MLGLTYSGVVRNWDAHRLRPGTRLDSAPMHPPPKKKPSRFDTKSRSHGKNRHLTYFMKLCVKVWVGDLINCAHYCNYRLRGFGVVWGSNLDLDFYICDDVFLMNIMFVYRREENMLFLTTPAGNQLDHVPIKLELADGSLINTSLTFEYRNNPNVTDITPRNHLSV